MTNRRVVIAATLFVIGVVVYLAASGAPLRVHVVTIAIGLLLATTVTFFLCSPPLGTSHRLVAFVLSVGAIAVASTWLSSTVIAALYPPRIMHFVITFAAFLLQSLIFAAAVWTIDFAVGHLSKRSSEPG